MRNTIDFLWNDLRVVSADPYMVAKYGDLDPSDYRLDDLGALIKKSEYGKQTEFGYTIDHCLPISKGGDGHIQNLRLLNWRNNELKGDDFPEFYCETDLRRGSDAITPGKKSKIKVHFTRNFLESLAEVYPNVLKY